MELQWLRLGVTNLATLVRKGKIIRKIIYYHDILNQIPEQNKKVVFINPFIYLSKKESL